MKSKAESNKEKAPRRETLADWLLANGGFLDEKSARILDEVVAARSLARPRPDLDFVKEALAEIAAEKRAKRGRKKR